MSNIRIKFYLEYIELKIFQELITLYKFKTYHYDRDNPLFEIDSQVSLDYIL